MYYPAKHKVMPPHAGHCLTSENAHAYPDPGPALGPGLVGQVPATLGQWSGGCCRRTWPGLGPPLAGHRMDGYARQALIVSQCAAVTAVVGGARYWRCNGIGTNPWPNAFLQRFAFFECLSRVCQNRSGASCKGEVCRRDGE